MLIAWMTQPNMKKMKGKKVDWAGALRMPTPEMQKNGRLVLMLLFGILCETRRLKCRNGSHDGFPVLRLESNQTDTRTLIRSYSPYYRHLYTC